MTISGILQHLVGNPGICERLREDLTSLSPNKKSMPTIYQLEGMPYFEVRVLFVRVLYGCHELYQEGALNLAIIAYTEANPKCACGTNHEELDLPALDAGRI